MVDRPFKEVTSELKEKPDRRKSRKGVFQLERKENAHTLRLYQLGLSWYKRSQRG